MSFWDREKYLLENPYFTKDRCPFCKIDEDEKQLLVYKSNLWEVRYNKYEYYWHKQHLLAFPIEHKEFTTQLSDNELIDFKNIEIFMKDYFWDKNYFSFIRQWTWWRSVAHLHYHYLEWIFTQSKENDKLFTVKNVSKWEK